MVRRIAMILAILANLSLLICIAARTSRANPILRGTSGEFWGNACGVSINGHHPYGIREPIDTAQGLFIYAVHGYTFDSINEAPPAAVLADFPKVIAALEARTSSYPGDFPRTGYRAWKALPAAQHTIDSLIAQIDEAAARQAGVSVSAITGSFWNERFHLHLAHANLYWATLSFEFLFLSFCLWWTAWPFLRPFRTWRYAFHLGLLPILFISPICLGYSTYVTGSYRIGPTVLDNSFEAGVIYPQLVSYIPTPRYFLFDLVIVQHLPKFLEPISLPYAGYMGPGTAMGGPLHNVPSITGCLLFGITIAGSIVLAAWLYAFGKSKPRQGFPVELHGPVGIKPADV